MKTLGQQCWATGELSRKAEKAWQLLFSCELCPRRCRVNRLAGELGFCGVGDRARIASYNPHFGEEQPLVGCHGSGTIFLAGCSLRCCFCQNYDISHHPDEGIEVDAQAFASMILDLQDRGCHNINFVTPSHVVPQIMAALDLAYDKGLKLPLIFNCSGYESTQTLGLLEGLIDIYMPDFKFWEKASALKYAEAADYPERARAAIKEMYRQVGDLCMDQEGLAVQGLLIRHLLMPGALEETKNILEFIARQLSKTTYVNIMDQYRPCGNCLQHQELQDTISPDHHRQATAYAEQIGLHRLDQRDLKTVLKRLGIPL